MAGFPLPLRAFDHSEKHANALLSGDTWSGLLGEWLGAPRDDTVGIGVPWSTGAEPDTF